MAATLRLKRKAGSARPFGSSTNKITSASRYTKGGPTSGIGPKRLKAMAAPMSAIEGSSGLVVLNLSFVDHDPMRPFVSGRHAWSARDRFFAARNPLHHVPVTAPNSEQSKLL